MKTETATAIQPALPLPGRRFPQVKLWSALGAISLVTIFSGWARWITSGDLTPAPTGGDPFPRGKLIFIRFLEFGSAAVGLYLAWRFVFRPLIRKVELTFDGMLIVAFSFAHFYDPVLVNYNNFTFAYNAHLLNFGNWTRFIPGWETPNMGGYPQPLLANVGFYVWWAVGSAVLGCRTLRRLEARYPHLSTLRLFTILAGAVAGTDLVVESLLVRTEIFQWSGTIHGLTLWAGRPHQFPLYEAILIASLTIGVVMLRHFRDERGRSFAERGVEELRLPCRARKLVSLLAITGFLHFWLVVSYVLPYQLISLRANTFPQLPSYMLAGLCGEGTAYACSTEFRATPRQK